MTVKFHELTKISGGERIAFMGNSEITHLLIDSRKLINNPGALFFAIPGNQHDGHQYLLEAYQAGIRQFVVSSKELVPNEVIKDSNVLVVSNVIGALQAIAKYHRSQYQIPIIAITGSNGKTIVKEWLSQILASTRRVIKSPKSYNSQVGVPLSLWQIDQHHEVGVFEAGISEPGEMEHLESMIKPTMGVFTNLGTAHEEGFASPEKKLNEKLRLFVDCEKIIHCNDQPLVVEAIQLFKAKNANVSCISWSFVNEESDYFFRVNNGVIAHRDTEYVSTFHDRINLENLASSIVAGFELGVKAIDIQQAVKMLEPVDMRLKMKRGLNGCYLIDDSYNNDLAGLRIALDFMAQQGGDRQPTIILSDILQAGTAKGVLYTEVNNLLINSAVNRFIGIGPEIGANRSSFEMNAEFYETTEKLIEVLPSLEFNNEIILIKGARSFAFERIVSLLQEKVHGTRLEVDLNSITHNLNFYRGLIKPETKMMVMVKALAYGGGSYEIASLLQYHRVDYLGVAYVDEAVELRKKGISLPVMVMNVSNESFIHLVTYNLEPEIYSLSQLNDICQYFRDDTIPKIHLKIDTGMHRLGFSMDEIPELIETLRANSEIEVASIFTHLASSDDNSQIDFTRSQLNEFESICNDMSTELAINPIRHALNSAGIAHYPDTQFDMVRLGIGLYGLGDSLRNELRPTSTLKSSISQIKSVSAGESVGYGRAFVAEKPIRIATVAIGYADGYDRRFGNGVGQMLINGKVARVIGHVCMDMTMLDITDVTASEGDEVIVFGPELPVSGLAESIGTIPYELLTSVGHRVKRVFLSD